MQILELRERKNSEVKMGGKGWCLSANYVPLLKSDYVQIQYISNKKR